MAALLIALGVALLAGLPRFIRHYVRMSQVARVRKQLALWLPDLKQPGGVQASFGVSEPPTGDSIAPAASTARCRRTVWLGDPSPSRTVDPLRRVS